MFFATPDDAQAAGFRACRRCYPDEADAQVTLVQQACAIIDRRLDNVPTLAELGMHLHISPAHLQRVFKRITGVTPRQYADARRQAQFKAALRDGTPVTDAVYEAGYRSTSRVTPDKLGMTPTDYQQGGHTMTIRYTTASCALGIVLVAATGRGVCAISLGDAAEPLEAALAEEFPNAERVRDNAGLGEWLAEVLRHLDGQQPHLDLPLDVQATAFQRRVWEALRAIPYGSTRTYSELAQAIGEPPTAARAVARACATNPAAVIIPCHRIVRSDGGMGGYRWGIERKEALLAQERAAANSDSPQKA
jgi:AraC family transcriptional regulator of adaptative response/methylated-DNA-[protein]-cysteine methyltransferase